MNGEFPKYYCKHCGQELKPYWLEGFEGMVRYDEMDGKSYKEYEVYYKCPSEKWYSDKDEHSFIIHRIQKLANSDYRLPESIKEYLRLNRDMRLDAVK